MIRQCFWILGIVLAACNAAYAGDPSDAASELRFFESHVRPVLATRCFKCHGESRQRADLRLDSREAMLSGGESGPAISLDDPQESLLLDAINHGNREMPPDGKLGDQEIAAITHWLSMGAPWPQTDAALRADPAARDAAKITAEDRAFWSFQPLRDVPVPDVDDQGWSRNAIDKFIYKRLTDEGLAPADEADRRTLVRRVYLDLTGLPPTPEQVADFIADSSPRAYENLIDQLLDSPRYGERWARHWLDLVRYAESDGFNQDAYRPEAWRYRDYVIRSFNEDKPYGQFVMEQLAGDELAPHDPDVLVATGYLRHWIYEFNQRDARTQWKNILNDVTDVTADVFLGLGMGCARCHDHKFDPILQSDYYRLQAYFAPLRPRDDVLLGEPSQLASYDKKLAAWETAAAEVQRQIAEIQQPILDATAQAQIDKFPPDIRPIMRKPPEERTPHERQIAYLVDRQVADEYAKIDWKKKLKDGDLTQWQRLEAQMEKLRAEKPSGPPVGLVVTDVGPEAPPTQIPGDAAERIIEPGIPLVMDSQHFPGIGVPEPTSESTGRRAALARWIASPNNALAMRVITNRVWQYHFGRGIVSTPSDFGRLGEAPSHPDLLEYLTQEFIDSGQSLKHLHRLIMTSATYRQTALRAAPELARQKDPENRWLWRMNVRRLDAEQIRDAALLATGELDPTAGGPGAEPEQPRRSIYLKMIRNKPNPLLAAFDAPDTFGSTATRNTTTTPNQALLMINGEWALERAEIMAEQLQQQFESDLAAAVDEAFQRVFQRSPSAAERKAATDFLRTQQQHTANVDGGSAATAGLHEPLTDFCHVLLNSNEFLYFD